MQEISFASPGTTDAPHVTVIPQLRGPNLDVARFEPTAGLGTSPTKPLGPKPMPPVQTLTARPLAHGLHIPTATSGAVNVTRDQLDQQMRDAGIDRIGQPAAWSAFGGAA